VLQLHIHSAQLSYRTHTWSITILVHSGAVDFAFRYVPIFGHVVQLHIQYPTEHTWSITILVHIFCCRTRAAPFLSTQFSADMQCSTLCHCYPAERVLDSAILVNIIRLGHTVQRRLLLLFLTKTGCGSISSIIFVWLCRKHRAATFPSISFVTDSRCQSHCAALFPLIHVVAATRPFIFVSHLRCSAVCT